MRRVCAWCGVDLNGEVGDVVLLRIDELREWTDPAGTP